MKVFNLVLKSLLPVVALVSFQVNAQVSVRDADGINPAVGSCNNRLFLNPTCSGAGIPGPADTCTASVIPGSNPDTLLEVYNRDANFNDLGPNVCSTLSNNSTNISCSNWCRNEGYDAGTCSPAAAKCPGTVNVIPGACACSGNQFDRIFEVSSVMVEFGRYPAGTVMTKSIKIYSLSEASNGANPVKMRLTGTGDSLAAPFRILDSSTCGKGAPISPSATPNYCTIDMEFTAPTPAAATQTFLDSFVVIGHEIGNPTKQSFRIDVRGVSLQ